MTSVEVSDNLIDHIAYCISDSILHKRIYHDATWHNAHNAHKKKRGNDRAFITFDRNEKP